MKRPSFQFYPADWRNNAKLRRCSWAARGVWIELIGLMHDSDTYGLLRWPLKQIAQALGCPVKLLQELVDCGVLYGCEKGACAAMVYTPVSARRKGAPVELVPAQPGPVWYSPRMVRDEYVRANAGASTRFKSPSHSPDTPSGHSPSRRHGEDQSDGSSSSSSSSTTAPIGASVDARQRFEMFEGWRPDEMSLKTQLRTQAVSPDLLTEQALGEFVAFWLTRSVADSQGGWCHRLVANLRRQQVRAAACPGAAPVADWTEGEVLL